MVETFERGLARVQGRPSDKYVDAHAHLIHPDPSRLALVCMPNIDPSRVLPTKQPFVTCARCIAHRDKVQPLSCKCPPCPGRGNDGHGMTHCAECCFGSGVEADPDCPIHGQTDTLF